MTLVDTVTFRMRLLPCSAMYTLPDVSNATPKGWFNVADVANPVSPLKPEVPVPAIVVMIPVDTVILRTR